MTTQAPASTSASTRDPKCNCPLQQGKPCDVKKLTVKVTRNTRADPSSQSTVGFSFAGTFDPAKERTLPIEKNHHRTAPVQAIVDKLGKTKAGLLSRYDLVIETTAQFAMGDKMPQNSVDIEVDVVWEGKCYSHEHGLLSMRTLSAPVGAARFIERAADGVSSGIKATTGAVTGGRFPVKPALLGNKGGMTVTVAPPPKIQGSTIHLGQSVSWALNTTHVKLSEVYAQPTDFDLAKPSGSPLSTAIRMLRMMWSFLTPMDFEFTADAHGIAVDKARVPNDKLLGLVRVYRETTFGIAMKFPPAARKKDETVQRGNAIDVKKEREIYLLIGGIKDSEERAHKKPAEYKPEDYKPGAFEIAFKVNDLELKLYERSTYEAADEAAKAKAEKLAGRAYVSNRAQMIATLWHCGEWKTAIKMVWEDLVKLLKAAREGLAKFWDWTKRFPQMGWKLEYEMTLFAGSMGLKFTQADGDVVAGRYAPLKWKGNFEIKLTVIEVKSKLSFGIMVDFGPVGTVDIRVFGEITGTVEASLEKFFMNADPDDGDKTVKIMGTVSGRLGAIAAVETFVYTWKREIFIQAGLRCTGSMKWEKHQTTYEINLTTLPVQWQFTAKNSRTKDAVAKVHTLCQEAHFMGYKDVVAVK